MDTSFDIEKHLEEEHATTSNPFVGYLKEIVYGGVDGIVTTFAVVAGFAGAQATVNQYPIIIVALFGLANLFADGVSMALGSFLSLRSEQDLYRLERDKERLEIANSPKIESMETIEILKRKGYSDPDAKAMTALYRKNKDYWADFMMHHELEIANPLGENPIKVGVATLVAFVIFGFIPLVPYLFLANTGIPLFTVSCIGAGLALLTLGVLRWKITKEAIVRSIGETVLVGTVAASVAYIVGSFFRI